LLNTEQTIRAWKDPEFRASLENSMLNHPAGEISEQELQKVVGGSDVQPQTTLLCMTVTFSYFVCP
jgi:mersacidin/lichenicidin family type 2 lantibiotic